MYKKGLIFVKKGVNVFDPLFKNYTTSTSNEKTSITLNKVLLFSKFSRYDFERHTLSKFNDNEFEKILRDRGTDYDKLVEHKILNKEFETKIIDTLKSMNIEAKIANRLTCTKDLTDWADVIMPTGGDGTFLLAAGKVRDNYKPVIGFNSSPENSEGYLCLPKKYTQNIREAIQKLKNGEFKWLMRSRIRTTMLSKRTNENPMDLQLTTRRDFDGKDGEKSLPILALNEVFASEQISAKTSHFSISLDSDGNFRKTKSSGVCIATGTGSTSWHFSMNRLPVESVAKLLELMNLKNGVDTGLAKRLADTYNQNLIFKSDDPRLCYTIRDMIVASVWPMPQGLEPCGYAPSIHLKSHCFDAGLVIDGNVSFPFNDGAEAVFRMYPEDALRTVVLNE